MDLKKLKDNKSKNILVSPHGGKLINLMVDDSEQKKKLLEELKTLPRLKLSTLEFSDLIMLGIGAFSPLEGFLNESDYKGVLDNMRLAGGILCGHCR